jgi:hypothetical protein
MESSVRLPEGVLDALRDRDHPPSLVGGEALTINAAALEEPITALGVPAHRPQLTNRQADATQHAHLTNITPYQL